MRIIQVYTRWGIKTPSDLPEYRNYVSYESVYDLIYNLFEPYVHVNDWPELSYEHIYTDNIIEPLSAIRYNSTLRRKLIRRY